MNFLRSSILLNIAAPILLGHFSRLMAGLFLIKAIAVSLGAHGVGRLANLMMLATLMLSFSAGGVSNAIAKYVAEYSDNNEQLISFYTALYKYVVISIAVAVLLFSLLAIYFKDIFFLQFSNLQVILTLSISYLATSVYVVGIGILNGLKKYWSACISISIGSLLAVWMTHELISIDNYKGAQFSILFFSAVPVLSLIIVLIKIKIWSNFTIVNSSPFRIGKLVNFSLMQCVSVVAMPLADFLVRKHLLTLSGVDFVGNWQGALRISAAYTSLFIAIFSAYFVPKFSILSSDLVLIHTWKMLRYISIIYIPVGCCVYVLSEFFVELILSPDFKLVIDNIGYMLFADYFKLMAYGLGFVLISRAKSKTVIIFEVLQMAIYIASVFSITEIFGFSSVFLSLPVISIAYFLLMMATFRIVIRTDL
ncbi:oligosaccharide flippase family protein [Chitinimonas sp. BJB300]|uniref:oligosaccharide flippase family protein n=1 Tax=Chitinimonas sp. BJB300 TaxID=1559339 RepID=UPI000C0F0461|nr:oligosaccharide flippase family protein [Chitinimonas sp. BJB300]PHV11153.1 hypothetical protein CSQ89_12395 [Chitinimonas sp. BJB300]TSJ85563.1 oligosaccharide flippase family protein [Chitinimonas sp. BJB300]